MPTTTSACMGQVKTTADNLSTAVSGETYEFTTMYPQMIEDAKAEGNKKAVQSFDYANKVEAIHADLYKKAIDSVKSQKRPPSSPDNGLSSLRKHIRRQRTRHLPHLRYSKK